MIATMLLGSLLMKSAPESAAVARRSKRMLRSIPTAFKEERHLRDDARLARRGCNTCRCITHPAIANERLALNRAGRVVLTLKTPLSRWHDAHGDATT